MKLRKGWKTDVLVFALAASGAYLAAEAASQLWAVLPLPVYLYYLGTEAVLILLIATFILFGRGDRRTSLMLVIALTSFWAALAIFWFPGVAIELSIVLSLVFASLGAVALAEMIRYPTRRNRKETKFFLDLLDDIQGWSPLERHTTEEGYARELRQHLERDGRYSSAPERAEIADILVGGKVPVEVKKNPTKADYYRFLGQLTQMHRAAGFAIGVVCDVQRPDLFRDMNYRVGQIWTNGTVALVRQGAGLSQA